MREIKFRAWVRTSPRHQNRMINVVAIDWKHNFIDSDNHTYPITGNVLMQYTGLHDKNSKEIYEDDIVRFTRVMNAGSIEERTRTFQFPVKFEDGCFVVDDWYLYEIECEVIGNIYENPELMQ